MCCDNSQSKLQSSKQTSSSDKSKRNSSCSSSKKSSRGKYYSHSVTCQSNVVQDSTYSKSTLDISIDVKYRESCSIEGVTHQDIADQTCTGESPHDSHHSKMQSIPEELKVPHRTHHPPIAPNDAEDAANTLYSRRSSAPTPATINKGVASRMSEAPILTKHASFTSYKSQRSADPDGHIINHENVKSKSTKKSSQEMRHSYFDISETNVAHDFTNSKRTLDMNTGVIRGERCVIGRGMKSDIAPNENDCSEMPEVFLATEGSGLNAHNRGEKSAKPAVNAFFTRRSSAPTPSTYIKGMVPRASQSPFPSKHASFISYKSQTSVNLDGQVDHDYTPKLHDLTQMSSDQPNRTADCSSLRKSAHETRQSYFVICETNIAQDFMNSKSTLEMNTGVKHGEKCGTWRGTQVDAVNQAHTTKNPHENECSSVPFIPTTQESELKITKHGDHLSNPSISSEAAVNTFFSRRSSAPTLTTNMGLAATRIREAPFPSKHVYLTSCKSQRLTGTNRHDMNRDNLHSESPKKSSQEMNRSYFAISETNVAQDLTNSKGTLEMNTSVEHVEYCSIRRGMHSDIANQTSKAEKPYENDFLVMPSIAMRQVSKLKKKKHSDHLSNPLVSSESDVKKFFGRRSSAPTSTMNKGIAAVSMRGAAFTSKHSSFTSYRSQMLTGNDRHDMNHDNFLSESPNKSSQEMNHSFVVSKTNVAQDFTDSKSTLEMNTSVRRREFCGFGRGVHSEIADQTSTGKGHDENDCFETHFISTTQESTLKEPNEGDCPSVPHINADLVVSPIFIRRSSAPTPSTFNEGMVSHASKAPLPSKHSSFTSYKSPRSIDPDGHVIDHNYTQYKQALKQISSDELKFNTDCSSPKKSVQEMNHSYFVISESNVAQDFTNSKSTLEMNTNDKQCVPLSPSSSHDFPIFEDRFSDNQPCQQQSLTKSNPKAVPKEENLMVSIPEYATPSPSAVGSRGKQESESESEERDLEDDTLEGSESYPCIFIPNSSAQLHAYSTCSSFSESTFSNMIASSFAMSFAENSGENEPEECSFIFASGMRHVLSVPPYDEGSYTGQIKELTKLPHGEGSFIHSSGELINGIWRDGVFIRRFYKRCGHSPSESHPSSQDKTPVVRNR
ncbi:hypothetical protein ACHAW6_005758 [Cyclotella cf. meneghiniana]